MILIFINKNYREVSVNNFPFLNIFPLLIKKLKMERYDDTF